MGEQASLLALNIALEVIVIKLIICDAGSASALFFKQAEMLALPPNFCSSV